MGLPEHWQQCIMSAIHDYTCSHDFAGYSAAGCTRHARKTNHLKRCMPSSQHMYVDLQKAVSHGIIDKYKYANLMDPQVLKIHRAQLQTVMTMLST